MDNPETLSTLCTQDTGWGQMEQTIQHRKLKRWATRTPSTLCTQDTRRRQTKHKNTTQKTIKMSNTKPPQKPTVNSGDLEE